MSLKIIVNKFNIKLNRCFDGKVAHQYSTKIFCSYSGHSKLEILASVIFIFFQ